MAKLFGKEYEGFGLLFRLLIELAFMITRLATKITNLGENLSKEWLEPVTDEDYSKSLLPSKLAKSTGCEQRFLALHFANEIYFNNTAEVMAQSKTKPEYFDAVVEFAKQIRMIPLPVRKEKAGYLLNSMLIPFLFSALDLLATELSDVESIDKAWTLGTGAPKGPFQILDIVGLKTAYNIVLMYVKIPSFIAPYHFKKIAEV